MKIVSEPSLIHVFAYGSNLCSRRIAARVERLHLVGVGSIAGYALRFNKKSRDGSAKANAHRTGVAEDVVWGAVYGLSKSDKERLDGFEGLGRGYFESPINVDLAEGIHTSACLYWANPLHTLEGMAPYEWYHRFCVQGAREHGLPADYVAHIAAIRPIADPDRDRHARETAILDPSYL